MRGLAALAGPRTDRMVHSNPSTAGHTMSPAKRKPDGTTTPATAPTANGSNPNPSAPMTLDAEALASAAAPATAPASAVTPEQAMAAINEALVKLGFFGGGQQRQALQVAGQRLHKALSELQAAEAHAKALRAGMGQLVTDALAAVAGKVLKATPATPAADPTPSNGTPTSDSAAANGGAS